MQMVKCDCNRCYYWKEGFCKKAIPALDMNGQCKQLVKFGLSTQFVHEEDKCNLNILNIVKGNEY